MIEDVLKKTVETVQLCVQLNENRMRLDRFCAVHLTNLSRSYVKTLIQKQYVQVNGQVKKASYALNTNDNVTVLIPEPEEAQIKAEDIPLNIVYEDDDVIVVDKPSGMVVHPAPGTPSGTLVNALMAHTDQLSAINGVKRPGIVHRIDKDTSGLLVVAKNDNAHQFLAKQLAAHEMVRQYHGLVRGNITEETGTVDMPQGRHPKERIKMAVVEDGRHAVTHFTVMKRFGKYTEMIFKLETGRTHQIRVHMQAIGHPLVGDPLYGVRRREPFETDGQMLHAEKLGFIHPTTKELMVFRSPLPRIFEEALAYCSNHQM
ncbi:RluA family pseudouridine synthase [Pseudoramibacter porci]|uniref:Pseudouridine synthase n=1 Tax=Pseudoramibacter porci TaxID=2606631 RepID=A0A7X2NEH5_9FIRM|nr:RluA family pseudouridine synthase [Pseudoramibacter porci]